MAGCHADITYRFEVHPDRQVGVIVREVVDDQLYQLAARRNESGDPLGANAAEAQGWTVTRSVDELNDHVLTLARTVPLSTLTGDIESALPRSTGGTSISFAPFDIQETDGLFSDTESLTVNVPAPMATPDGSSPWSGLSNELATSMIGLHFELKSPGTVLASNGETTPDGFTRWNINLQEPTQIRYTTQFPDITHIIAVILLLLAAIIITIYLVRQRPLRQ